MVMFQFAMTNYQRIISHEIPVRWYIPFVSWVNDHRNERLEVLRLRDRMEHSDGGRFRDEVVLFDWTLVKAWNQNYHQDNGDWTGENGDLEGNNGFLPTKIGLQLAKLSVWWISNGGLMGLTNKKCDFMGFSFGYQTKFGHLADHADRIETHLGEQFMQGGRIGGTDRKLQNVPPVGWVSCFDLS